MGDQANLENGGNNDQSADGGDKAPAWTAQLDKDLQGNERLTQFKTIGEMGKTLLELEGKSKNALYIPGETSTDEEKAAFYSKLGRPESPDKYTYTRPADLPPEIPYTAEVETVYKQLFHKVGLSDAQAKEITETHLNLAKQGLELQQKTEREETEKAINTLKDEWKGDAFKENSELAVRAFRELGGGEEGKKFIEETKVNGIPLGNHPIFLKIFANIGKQISDDRINSGRDGNNGELSEEDKAKARFPNTKFK